MNRKLLKCIVLILICLSVFYFPVQYSKKKTQANSEQTTPLETQEYIVKLKPNRSKRNGISKFRAKRIRESKDGLIQKVYLTNTSELHTIKNDPDVIYIEPDIKRTVTAEPDDTYFNSSNTLYAGEYDQWDMRKIGLLPKSDSNSAWNITTGSSSVTVAVIDTGVDITHPDLADNIWVNSDEIPNNGIDDDGNGYIDDYHGYNFAIEDSDNSGIIGDFEGYDANNDGDFFDCIQDNTVPNDGDCDDTFIIPCNASNGTVQNACQPDADVSERFPDLIGSDPRDWDGHGTHVSGTIAAVSNNTTGVAGVCWTCKIMPLRVVYTHGYAYDSDISAAIHYAVDNGAQIINISLGGPGYSQTLQDAINFAWNNNVLVVSAAGNYANPRESYPGAAEHSLSIGATTRSDTTAPFSYPGNRIDVMAPGDSIVSTFIQNISPRPTCGFTGAYFCLSGTSMAAPHVSGIAALLVANNDEWTVQDIRWALLKNTDDIFAMGYDINSGYGRVNAQKALVATPALFSDTQAPTGNLTAPASALSGTYELKGSAIDENLYMYTIYLSSGNTVIAQYFGRNSVTNNTLATIDTSEYSNGTYKLSMHVEDFAGNITTSNEVTIIINNAIPGAFSLKSPINNIWINTSKPTFQWNASASSDAITYEVKVDSVSIGNGITSTSFTAPSNISQGAHQWEVIATNTFGQSRVSNSGTFRIDTTPPNNFSINVSIQGTTPTFSFSTNDTGSGVAGYQISIDGSSYISINSPYQGPSLPDGNHSATIRAIDHAGNITTAQTSFSINYRIPFLKSKADFNSDGIVDLSDLSILAQYWQKSSPLGDANNDGIVDLSDLSILAQNWQKSF